MSPHAPQDGRERRFDIAMSKTGKSKKAAPAARESKEQDYKDTLRRLQMELVKLQRHFIKCDDKILIILEGRDAAGKDGAIKRIVQHLSPRETRIVALGKPSDRDRAAWYFQRYIPHLPVSQELVLFNRSWYNRAGVERVMGFCTKAEYEEFMASVSDFEHMLVRSGLKLLKYYLDISKDEQTSRLKSRARDPLKQWKVSPIDDEALKHWKQYSDARNEMLVRSHNPMAPWTVVRADDKHAARLNIIKDVLTRLHYKPKNEKLIRADPQALFSFDPSYIESGLLAP